MTGREEIPCERARPLAARLPPEAPNPRPARAPHTPVRPQQNQVREHSRSNSESEATQIRTTEQSQPVGQGNSIRLRPVPPWPRPEPPCDREEKALSWAAPCLPAKAPQDPLAPHPAWGGAGGPPPPSGPGGDRRWERTHQEKPRARTGFKVKALQIKKDRVCVLETGSWTD